MIELQSYWKEIYKNTFMDVSLRKTAIYYSYGENFFNVIVYFQKLYPHFEGSVFKFTFQDSASEQGNINLGYSTSNFGNTADVISVLSSKARNGGLIAIADITSDLVRNVATVGLYGLEQFKARVFSLKEFLLMTSPLIITALHSV